MRAARHAARWLLALGSIPGCWLAPASHLPVLLCVFEGREAGTGCPLLLNAGLEAVYINAEGVGQPPGTDHSWSLLTWAALSPMTQTWGATYPITEPFSRLVTHL